MGHSHAHHHHHDHCHTGDPTGRNIRSLTLVLVITALYMVVEMVGGLLSNSLSLLADAGHMLTDVGTLALALFAAWFARYPASRQKTYGYYRLEIFAALINGILLVLISGYVFFEAFQRASQPMPVQGVTLTWIAIGGLAVNLLCLWILLQSGRDNINTRAAFMHVLSDSLGSVGAIAAGLMVMWFNWTQADVFFSVLIAILVLINAWKLMGEALNVLLEACPVHLSVQDIQAALMDLHEVHAVHDLHVWTITSGRDALSAHVIVEDPAHYTPDMVLKIRRELKQRFGLSHVTIQLETGDFEEDDIHF